MLNKLIEQEKLEEKLFEHNNKEDNENDYNDFTDEYTWDCKDKLEGIDHNFTGYDFNERNLAEYK